MNNLFNRSKEVLSTHSTSRPLLLFPTVHQVMYVSNNLIIIKDRTENNSLLYLESLTNDEVQMGDLDARMGQPKDPKQQHILLLLLSWWSLGF